MDESERPTWNSEQAEQLIGKTVLIGITRLWSHGAEHEQMFGVVTLTDSMRGIAVELDGSRSGQTYWLPPDLRSFAPAPLGNYRLKSTGETVIDPHYTSSWTIAPPKAGSDAGQSGEAGPGYPPP